MSSYRFNGDKKVGSSILTGAEMAFKKVVTPLIPKQIETYHLTMTTVLWSILNIVFGVMAQQDLRWLWGVAILLVIQYFTDLLDGAVGRYRKTGLIKWGFFMDHFLDTVFLGSLIGVGFLIAPPGMGSWFLLLLGLVIGFMVNAFLSFAATNEFEIYHYGVGPTEGRIAWIAIFLLISFTGTAHFVITVPVFCIFIGLGLAAMVYRTHRKLWQIDMSALS